MKNIITIIKKELGSYFNNPTAYIALVSFLLLWEFLFFKSVFQVGVASLSNLFMLLPWVFLLIIPALTMGTVAQEKAEGTLELLLSRPLRESEFIIGKFLASVIFLMIAMLFSLPIAMWLNSVGNLDWGVFWGQYIASVFLASTLSALGILISSLFKSQVSALLVTAVSGFFIIIAGLELVTSRIPSMLIPFFEQFSVLTHFESMSRGVLDLRDVWYFISIAIAFLVIAHLLLLKAKFGNQKKVYRNFQLGTFLLVGIILMTNIIGARIPGRVDLTEEKVYTLSETTKETLNSLDDLVEITFFTSNKLPSPLQPTLREIKDVLKDYKTLGKGNIKLEIKYPSGNDKAAKEASSLGVEKIPFDVIRAEERQLNYGYLGLAVAYGGEHESLPFIQDTSDLEYQLTSFIVKLTSENKKTVAFLSGHGEKSLTEDLQILKRELSKQFKVTTINPESLQEEASLTKITPKNTDESAIETPRTIKIPAEVDVLVVAGTSEEVSAQERTELKRFIDEGGNVFFMIDNIMASPEVGVAREIPTTLADFVKKELAVEVKKDLVYDLHSNEIVQAGGGPFPVRIRYPFWARTVSTQENLLITKKVQSLVMPWVSSISIDKTTADENSIEIKELITTTESGSTQSGQFDIRIDQEFNSSNLGVKLLAVSVSKDNSSRFVITGDSDFLVDRFTSGSSGNLAFGMESISWLAQEKSLSEIQFRNQTDRTLQFEDENQPNIIKFSSLAIALIVPTGFGVLRMTRRKNAKQRSYEI
ncbi:ABC transporter permease subunit [bacterium]|jgi:ABC-type transport system involved in multi-copper enzyme maturation permease subunit/ABC-type uncharacterized transport system involved in gliding motility auxiliary subunit|nr:ABC transporter permease subunit [bacterium]MBT4250777.1 ABC transporter permease subunit [bacterium]MBT4598221.1 ABC transporter permease subunit [bacterium]MBT6753819.1 ABC transporter permease subunit [bacterium]MBT7037468.1 ABC transporter permease subunit [bacterium]